MGNSTSTESGSETTKKASTYATLRASSQKGDQAAKNHSTASHGSISTEEENTNSDPTEKNFSPKIKRTNSFAERIERIKTLKHSDTKNPANTPPPAKRSSPISRSGGKSGESKKQSEKSEGEVDPKEDGEESTEEEANILTSSPSSASPSSGKRLHRRTKSTGFLNSEVNKKGGCSIEEVSIKRAKAENGEQEEDKKLPEGEQEDEGVFGLPKRSAKKPSGVVFSSPGGTGPRIKSLLSKSATSPNFGENVHNKETTTPVRHDKIEEEVKILITSHNLPRRVYPVNRNHPFRSK